jgi:hypothetical protein
MDMQNFAHEEELACERATENGRAVFTMYALIQAIANAGIHVFLCFDCKLFLNSFKQFTRLTPPNFSEEDKQFLRVFLEKFIEVKPLSVSDKSFWQNFFESFWISQEFLQFEEKFAERVIIPIIEIIGVDMIKNFHQLSDKLDFSKNLFTFCGLLKINPTPDQLVTGFFNSAGLLIQDESLIAQFQRKVTEANRKVHRFCDKIKDLTARLTSAQLEHQSCLRDLEDRSAFITRRYDFEVLKNAELESKLAELQLLLKAFEQQKAQELPVCGICTEFIIHSSDQKVIITSCCGYPFHDKCLDENLKYFPNPLCPYCRAPDFVRGHLSGNHPLLRKPEPVRRGVNAGTSVCESDLFEDNFRDIFEENEEIPQQSFEPVQPRKISIYASLLGFSQKQSQKPHVSSGGGAGGGRGAAGGGAAGGGAAVMRREA